MAKKVETVICPGCEEEVKEDDSCFMQASDRPYKNIWWHKGCWNKARSGIPNSTEEWELEECAAAERGWD